MRYVVTTPWGTFKRTSARQYRFLVTVCGEVEDRIRATFARRQTELERRQAQYVEGIRTGKIPPGAYPFDDVARYPAYLESVQKQLATHEAGLAARLATNAERIAQRRGLRAGWTSRRDLADREYAKAVREGFANVHIYAVVDEPPYTVGQEVA